MTSSTPASKPGACDACLFNQVHFSALREALRAFLPILNNEQFDVFDRIQLGTSVWKTLRAGIRDPLMLHGADLRGLPLDGADFSGCELGDADLTGMEASRVNFSQANLSSAKLCGVRALSCKWDGANCENIDMSDAAVDGITFGGNWRGVRFINAKLSGVRFSEAVDFEGADFSGCQVKAALFSGKAFKNVAAKMSHSQRVQLRLE